MGAFGLPAASKLPAHIESEIRKSTEQFEKRFGYMAVVAKSNGWIQEYENELRRIAALALTAEK